jgi:hypothetical protein
MIRLNQQKDEVLDSLSKIGNVAQFVSFGPDGQQRFSQVTDYSPNHKFTSRGRALDQLLRRSGEGSVNVRSYLPERSKSNEFVYGLHTVAAVEDAVAHLSAKGLYTIVNETIDIHDGGVSGVTLGGVMEFSPDDTPRCVEKPGILALPYPLGLGVLNYVYGPASVKLPEFRPGQRIEFSIHPMRRGVRNAAGAGAGEVLDVPGMA